MKQSILLWFIAFILTAGIAVYQRMTGPTYPISGKYEIDDKVFSYKLLRTHGGNSDCEIIIPANKNISGTLYYKRYKTKDDYTKIDMVNKDGFLKGFLPHQPPAGKLKYFVELNYKHQKKIIPQGENVIIRFKGDVPLMVLILHVIAMFGAMLLSVRTGLEVFKKAAKVRKLTIITLLFLFVGGFILGPIVQKYAFGVYWSGFPFGFDLTDNKTAITFIGWLVAFLLYNKVKTPKYLALAASILLIIIYLIPHSVLGSELDYNKLDKLKNKNIMIDSNKTGEK